MKNMLSLILITLLITLTSSCIATLTPGGKSVKYVMKSEAPSSCKKIEEITITAGTIQDMKIRMRNSTAQIGGNFLVIDLVEVERSGTVKNYTGNGRIYRCLK